MIPFVIDTLKFLADHPQLIGIGICAILGALAYWSIMKRLKKMLKKQDKVEDIVHCNYNEQLAEEHGMKEVLMNGEREDYERVKKEEFERLEKIRLKHKEMDDD